MRKELMKRLKEDLSLLKTAEVNPHLTTQSNASLLSLLSVNLTSSVASWFLNAAFFSFVFMLVWKVSDQ